MRVSRLPPEYRQAVEGLSRALRIWVLLIAMGILLEVASLLGFHLGKALAILGLGILGWGMLYLRKLRCPRCRSRALSRVGWGLFRTPRFCPRCGLALCLEHPNPRAEYLSPGAFRVYLDSLHRTPHRGFLVVLLTLAWLGFVLVVWIGVVDMPMQRVILALGTFLWAEVIWGRLLPARCPLCGTSVPGWVRFCPRCGVAFNLPPSP